MKGRWDGMGWGYSFLTGVVVLGSRLLGLFLFMVTTTETRMILHSSCRGWVGLGG